MIFEIFFQFKAYPDNYTLKKEKCPDIPLFKLNQWQVVCNENS